MTDFQVATRCVGFAPGIVPAWSDTSFTDSDLAAALFTTGRAPGDEVRHGWASVAEFVHRSALIPAYVRQEWGGHLIRSALATELDRSEKVNLSYSLGQAMAGVFAQQRLGVARLMHVDRYSAHHGVSFGPSRERPDLFGVGRGGWVVVEAKGRSNRMESDLPAKVKAQASNVASIGGAAPWVACGVVAQFPPPGQTMQLYALDPEPTEVALSWQVDPDRFTEAYYAPFLRALDVGRSPDLAGVAPAAIEATDLGAVGVRIGLHRRLAGLLREREGEAVAGLAREVDSVLEGLPEEEAIRPDGSWFDTSWGDALGLRDVES